MYWQRLKQEVASCHCFVLLHATYHHLRSVKDTCSWVSVLVFNAVKLKMDWRSARMLSYWFTGSLIWILLSNFHWKIHNIKHQHHIQTSLKYRARLCLTLLEPATSNLIRFWPKNTTWFYKKVPFSSFYLPVFAFLKLCHWLLRRAEHVSR